LEPEEA